ncbi:MAG: hypothetical protein J4224_00950 [Candidatus Diapherotrites archaeon]|uniref:Uncharacterized protein n=1 Tax=Candidatus Iainarchaeum sp. TaxID=3101447 RepID=A0A7J4J143_9ARCH|nr:MAG: hypothetical protein QT03_C0001G0751 [archaeon GW2011_AR10]MBS3058977.1 hypothetical protein [Candidatus Diapherotrites archaeon]HIH08936.1 hypothetical protein [Candidatus Diapherotrites archaeon]
MDTFNFLVSILLIIIAIQYQQNWIVFAILIISILSTRSLSTAITLIISTIVVYAVLGSGDISSLFPVVVFGLIIFALVLGLAEKPKQPEYYPPDPGYGEMLGGG